MKYDVEAIRERVNNMIANLKKACDEEDWATAEGILCNPLYNEGDIPRVKQIYQVTLKRVLVLTAQFDAYDEEDAIVQAQEEHRFNKSNMNLWDWDEDKEPEVELVKEN